MVAIILLPGGGSCPWTLARRRLAAEWAPLPLNTAEVLVRELVSKTGGDIIGVVSALTLLIRGLRCWKVLLLVLALVLILLLLPILLRVLVIHEIAPTRSICCRILKRTSDIVIVALTSRGLED